MSKGWPGTVPHLSRPHHESGPLTGSTDGRNDTDCPSRADVEAGTEELRSVGRTVGDRPESPGDQWGTHD